MELLHIRVHMLMGIKQIADNKSKLPSGVNAYAVGRNRHKAMGKSQPNMRHTKRTAMPRPRTHTHAQAPAWPRNLNCGPARQAQYSCGPRVKRYRLKRPSLACGIERSPNVSLPADVLATT